MQKAVSSFKDQAHFFALTEPSSEVIKLPLQFAEGVVSRCSSLTSLPFQPWHTKMGFNDLNVLKLVPILMAKALDLYFVAWLFQFQYCNWQLRPSLQLTEKINRERERAISCIVEDEGEEGGRTTICHQH